ncbi:MAG: hypothetical protein WA890_23040 [Micromonospora sp.]
MILDDFVMLGTTVPEPNSDGRVFVCSAGYSPTLRSLVRVYPLARYGAPARWSVSTVKLQRNPKDSRMESFQLAGDRRPGVHDDINRVFQVADVVPKNGRVDLLRRCVVGSIKEANERRLSLAIVHADAMELEFEHNPASPDSPQLALFDVAAAEPSGARRFPYIPRLRFRDERGDHRLMLRDWGVYELMRKNNNLTQMSDGERRKYVGGALRLDPTCSLLVGNLNNQRNAWLVISVLRGLRAAPSLLDELVGAAT